MKRSTFLLTLFSIPFFKYVKRVTQYKFVGMFGHKKVRIPDDGEWHNIMLIKNESQNLVLVDGIPVSGFSISEPRFYNIDFEVGEQNGK